LNENAAGWTGENKPKNAKVSKDIFLRVLRDETGDFCKRIGVDEN